MRLLKPQVIRPVGLVDRLTVAKGVQALQAELSSLKQQGIAHVVVDAVANTDLEVIASACMDMPLITGGSAIAMPLPALYMAEGLLPPDAMTDQQPQLGTGSIVLSGSCSAMTNKQVSVYIEGGAPSFRLDPLELAENGPQAAIEWLATQDHSAAPIIYATADPANVKAAQDKLGAVTAGKIVEQALASCALAARDVGVRCFVVAGGETSGAVTKALDITRLEIGPEIAPGVPWTFCHSQGYQIALSLKSGNFGTETFFTQALTRLDAL